MTQSHVKVGTVIKTVPFLCTHILMFQTKENLYGTKGGEIHEEKRALAVIVKRTVILQLDYHNDWHGGKGR